MNCIKIKLEEKFFQVEERAGYIVDEEKKRLWAVELDLLQEFFRVCKENNIEAYAFAGTLLGAIRHEGFIPWDDDIDICMTRENYNKLERIAEEVFRYPYFFQTARNDTHFFSNTPRLRNSETTGVIPWEYSPNYNGGIFLDCFIMDAVPENDFLFKLQRKELLILQELLRAYKPDTSIGQAVSNERHKLVKWMVKKCCKYTTLLHIYDWISQRYNGKSDVLALTCTALFSERYRCRVDDLKGDNLAKFECLEIPIPQNAQRILSDIYGNYLQYPTKKQIENYHNDRIIIDTSQSYIEYFKKHNDNIVWDEKMHQQIIDKDMSYNQ